MTGADPILELRGVSRLYRQGDQAVRALDHVDLTLERGEFVVVAGPSGSGKTTLLNVAAGLDLPTEGRVWVAGREVGRLSRRERAALRLRHLGFVFQAYNLTRLRLRPTRHVLRSDRSRWRNEIDHAVGGQGSHRGSAGGHGTE